MESTPSSGSDLFRCVSWRDDLDPLEAHPIAGRVVLEQEPLGGVGLHDDVGDRLPEVPRGLDPLVQQPGVGAVGGS